MVMNEVRLTLHVVKNIPDTWRAVLRRAGLGRIGDELLSGGVSTDQGGKLFSGESFGFEMGEGFIAANICLGNLAIWSWTDGIDSTDVCPCAWPTRTADDCMSYRDD